MKHPDQHCDQEVLSAMMDGEWQASDVRARVVDVCRDEALRACWARFHLARDAMHAEAIDVRGSVAAGVSSAIAAEPAYSNVTAIGATLDTPVPARTSTGALVASGALELAGGRDAARGATVRTFAAGFGLAASVALVTVVGLNAWQGGADETGASAAGADVASSVTPTTPGSPDERTSLASASAPPADTAPGVDPFATQVPGAPLPSIELVANTGAFWSAPESSTRRAESEERLNMLLSRHLESSPTAERQGMLPYSRLVGYDERTARGR